MQRLSVAVQRGNAACVLGTVPASIGLDELFYIKGLNFCYLFFCVSSYYSIENKLCIVLLITINGILILKKNIYDSVESTRKIYVNDISCARRIENYNQS